MKTRIAGLVIAALLAGCGGGGGGASVTPSHSSGNAGPQIVKLSLKIPTKAKQVQRKVLINGKYVSPATLGAGLVYSTTATSFTSAQLAAPTVAIDLSACTTTAFSTCATNADGSQTFTVQLPVPPGNYTAELATWDASPTGGTGTSSTFSGNLLSTAPLTFAVVAGQAPTPLSFTLNGIPASVTITDAPIQTHVVYTGTGYRIIGNAAQVFYANALDVDGFLITGSGAPVMAMSDATGSFSFVQSGTSPNQFGVYAQSAALQNTNGVTVTATATSPVNSGIATVSAKTTMIPVPEMWIADSSGNVSGYEMNISTANSTSSLANSPLDQFVTQSNPASLGSDSGGNIWTTESANVQEIGAPSFASPLSASNNFLNDPCGSSDVSSGMAFDVSFHMWITSPTCGTSGGVYEFTPVALGTPTHQITAAQSGTLAGAMSVSIAPNTSGVPAALRGAIFVGTAPATGAVDVLTLSGSTLTDTYPGAVTNSVGKISTVAVGEDGTLWVYDGTNLNAYAMAPAGSSLNASLISNTSEALSGSQMAVDPIGHVWAAQAPYIQSFYVSGSSVASGSNQYISTAPTGISIAP